jgi:hypothetical protein
MTVFIVETYVVKPEKQAEFKSLPRKWQKYMKENTEKLKEMKSWKLYTQTFGSISGAYIEQVEYDSLAEHEKCNARLLKDQEYLKLYQEAMALIDTATFSMSAWEPVK